MRLEKQALRADDFNMSCVAAPNFPRRPRFSLSKGGERATILLAPAAEEGIFLGYKHFFLSRRHQTKWLWTDFLIFFSIEILERVQRISVAKSFGCDESCLSDTLPEHSLFAPAHSETALNYR